MSDSHKTHKTHAPKYVDTSCDSCEFYDYDEELDAYVCDLNLDQDEMQDFLAGQTTHCPYYRYYDEYKSVHKQL